MQIIARADELTSARLAEIRAAVARDFRREGLSYGVLHHNETASNNLADSATLSKPTNVTSSVMIKSQSAPELPVVLDAPPLPNGDSHNDDIKVLQPPLVRIRSRSITRRKALGNLELDLPTPSTAALQKSLPFALMAPEVMANQPFDSAPLTRLYVSNS